MPNLLLFVIPRGLPSCRTEEQHLWLTGTIIFSALSTLVNARIARQAHIQAWLVPPLVLCARGVHSKILPGQQHARCAPRIPHRGCQGVLHVKHVQLEAGRLWAVQNVCVVAAIARHKALGMEAVMDPSLVIVVTDARAASIVLQIVQITVARVRQAHIVTVSLHARECRNLARKDHFLA